MPAIIELGTDREITVGWQISALCMGLHHQLTGELIKLGDPFLPFLGRSSVLLRTACVFDYQQTACMPLFPPNCCP